MLSILIYLILSILYIHVKFFNELRRTVHHDRV